MAILRIGSDRTNGASINTGTDTKNTAAANTNQVSRPTGDMGIEGDKASVDSNLLMLCEPNSLVGTSVLIAVVGVVYEDKVLLIKVFNICY